MPRSVRISALALVKMTMHCRSGGNLEARRQLRQRHTHDPKPLALALSSRLLPLRLTRLLARHTGQVMGMMQGKTMGDTFVVLDSFALPVEGARRGGERACCANNSR